MGPPGAVSAHEAKLEVGHSTQRVLSVSMANLVGRLRRPPVKFDHEKHTSALESDGCGTCHPKADSGEVSFTYPKDRDETRPSALMDSFHDSCTGCHTARGKQGKETGPVTCGECHVIDRGRARKAYEPVLPDYYDGLRDAYHKQCTACHGESAKAPKHARELDWQKYYITEKEGAHADWPKVSFDYLVHAKHNMALMGQCGLCHYISPERWKELKAEARMPAGQDWVIDVDESHDLSRRPTAHARCINCHLQLKDQPAGPVNCRGCHSGVRRTIKELAAVPRPQCEREEKILIKLEKGAHLKGVAFNHESHIAHSRACQDCHHKSLQPCQDCHTVKGSEHGGWVTLAEAHHDETSSHSCVGCHERRKSRPDCAGCHQNMRRGLIRSACSGCHNGSLEELDKVVNLPDPKELIPDGMKDEMAIGKIENEYGPSEFPHLEIVEKLTRISNESPLARHFHTDKMTICSGCHHLGSLEKAGIPPCSTCHTIRNEPSSGIPTLMGAYHEQCVGCHKQMDPKGQEYPQNCVGCHQEKTSSADALAAHQ